MINVTMDEKIHLNLLSGGNSWWPGVIDQVYADMTLNNPAYVEAVKYDRSIRNIPRRIVLHDFDESTNKIHLPRGYAGRLLKAFKDQGVSHQLIDNRVTLPAVDFGSRIVLRDYQVPAVEAVLKGTQGVLQAPAGSGKTQMGLEVIARVGQPALWLTHTKDLAEQAADRAAKFLSIPRGEIGMLGAGRESVGPRLTIGIIQKMSRMDLPGLAKKWGCVVLDECHHTGGAVTWVDVINQLPAQYRYGVTATFERADGLEVITNLVIGPTLHKIEREVVTANGEVITPALKLIRTVCVSPAWEKYQAVAAAYESYGKKPPPAPFGKIIGEVLGDPERNSLIMDLLVRECPGHCSLVLSERVVHCQELRDMLKIGCPQLRVEVIHGKLGKGARGKILAAMNAGELDVLFAVDIAKEGLDIPRLDRLFLVAGGRNLAETEQKVGRVQRAFPGKTDAVVFDFVDEKIGIFMAQYWARKRVYQKLGLQMVN